MHTHEWNSVVHRHLLNLYRELHSTAVMGVASHPGGARSSLLFQPSAPTLILSW